MALPRYKGNTYAIPYDGSEVKLHWANADQYYIKTTEQHADYTAVLDGVSGLDKPRLRFRLAAAESDRDNNKSSEKRRYVLRDADPVEVGENELTVWFEYRVPEPGNGRQPTQNALCEVAEKAILAAVRLDWQVALTKKASQSPDKYTALGYQLYRYAKKNTSDYFIHKDLGGFLRRELDFFIKNEVLFLDDLEGRTSAEIDVALQKVKATRAVGGKIIDWLAQLEDFQRTLFLKRPLVLSARWESVGVDGVSRRAPVDIPDNDVAPAVIAVCAENSRALRLLSRDLAGRVSCLYLDPPYNTDGDGFLYKDSYQHSTWLSMLADRLRLAGLTLDADYFCWISIDDRELAQLRLLGDSVLGSSRFVSSVAVVNNLKGRQDRDHIATAHEYVLLWAGPDARSNGLPLSQDKLDEYNMTDADGRLFQLRDLRKRGGADTRKARPNLFFPIYWSPSESAASMERHSASDIEVFPLKSDMSEGCWRWGRAKVTENLGILEAKPTSSPGRWNVSYRVFLDNGGGERTGKPKSVFFKKDYSSDRGIKDLRRQVSDTDFTSPKSPAFIRDIVLHSCSDEEVVLDPFAGSGTTAEGVFLANEADGGTRTCVLIDSGDHFVATLSPRIIGAAKRAAARSGPQMVKSLFLESYDDTLENITLTAPDDAMSLLQGTDALREDYTLRYMLNLEAEGSLLNLERFRKPWDYTIKVRREGVVQESPVDLVETFNYLIGLRVKRYDTYGQDALLFVLGTEPDGRRVIVVWRDCDLWPNERLEEKCRQAFESFRPDEFDLVYVNGDNHLPIIKTGEEAWKVNLIEETFHARMFDTSDVE